MVIMDATCRFSISVPGPRSLSSRVTARVHRVLSAQRPSLPEPSNDAACAVSAATSPSRALNPPSFRTSGLTVIESADERPSLPEPSNHRLSDSGDWTATPTAAVPSRTGSACSGGDDAARLAQTSSFKRRVNSSCQTTASARPWSSGATSSRL